MLRRNPGTPVFLLGLAGFGLIVTLMAEGSRVGVMSTSVVRTLGKTLCLVALAMDLLWDHAGILSPGHMAFFTPGATLWGCG